MSSPLLAKTINHWNPVAEVVPHSENEYQRLSALLDELLNTVGDDESHPLANLLETLTTLIEVYEQAHHPVDDVPASEVLRFLMQEHGLRPHDLPEMGPEGEVLELLNGQRELNISQIQYLSQRFHVSPAVFL